MIIFSFLGFFGCPKKMISSPPTPEEIFALNQKNTILNSTEIQNQHTVINLDIPVMKLSGKVDAWFVKEEGTYAVTELPGIGTQKMGYVKASDLVWSMDPMTGNKILSGKEKKSQINNFEETFLDMNARFLEATYAGLETINESMAHKITAKDRMDVPVTLYFDTENFYLIRKDSTLMVNGGEIISNMYFDDFQTIEGNIIATKLTINMMNMEQIMTIEILESNLEKTPTISIPTEIQELLEERKAPKEATPEPEEIEIPEKLPVPPTKAE